MNFYNKDKFCFLPSSHFTCIYTSYVTTSMGCDAKNLIYLMQCSGCDEEYIGEAGDSLRHRMTVHRQQIRNSNFRIQHVSNHIATCASVVRAVTGEFRRKPGSSRESRRYTTIVRCAHLSTSTGSMSYCSRQ